MYDVCSTNERIGSFYNENSVSSYSRPDADGNPGEVSQSTKHLWSFTVKQHISSILNNFVIKTTENNPKKAPYSLQNLNPSLQKLWNPKYIWKDVVYTLLKLKSSFFF